MSIWPSIWQSFTAAKPDVDRVVDDLRRELVEAEWGQSSKYAEVHDQVTKYGNTPTAARPDPVRVPSHSEPEV